MSNESAEFDVVVVGGGPGGIAAAVTAADAGLRVGLIDDGSFAGGQIWRNRGESTHPRLMRYWLGRMADTGNAITFYRQSRVVAAPLPSTLLVENPNGASLVRWKSLILATGSRELFLPFPGWTLPGVLGAGAMQALVKQGLQVRGKRIVVAGTGPLLLAVAKLLRSKGAVVPMILEQAPAERINRFALSLLQSPSKLMAGIALRVGLLGTSYCADSYPICAARGSSSLRVDYRTGQITRSVGCDYLACGFNLIPNNELPRLLGCHTTGDGLVVTDAQLRTTVPNIFAVGELTGIGGAEKALVEGCIAAHTAAGNHAAAASMTRHHASALRFAARLKKTFELRPELINLAQPDTIICRCEDVPLSAIRNCVSGRDAKLQTRCGMGPCQGRICGPILEHLHGSEPTQIRPPIYPVNISTLIVNLSK